MIDKEFIEDELEHLQQTMFIIMEECLGKNDWSAVELAGCGKFLSDMYMGYENIFRALLEGRGIHLFKGEHWHSDLLQRAIEEGIVPYGWEERLRGMLSFRHFQIHGYGRITNEQKLRANLAEVAANHHIFVAHIRKILDDD